MPENEERKLTCMYGIDQALLLADQEYKYINVRQKISHLVRENDKREPFGITVVAKLTVVYQGFLGPGDQPSSGGPSGPLAMEFALRLDKQFKIGNGLMAGHLCTVISEINWEFSELEPQYHIVASPDANVPWTDTPSKPATDSWQALSDALRQSRQRCMIGMSSDSRPF